MKQEDTRNKGNCDLPSSLTTASFRCLNKDEFGWQQNLRLAIQSGERRWQDSSRNT